MAGGLRPAVRKVRRAPDNPGIDSIDDAGGRQLSPARASVGVSVKRRTNPPGSPRMVLDTLGRCTAPIFQSCLTCLARLEERIASRHAPSAPRRVTIPPLDIGDTRCSDPRHKHSRHRTEIQRLPIVVVSRTRADARGIDTALHDPWGRVNVPCQTHLSSHKARRGGGVAASGAPMGQSSRARPSVCAPPATRAWNCEVDGALV
jgi:hypothetical protein